MEWIGVLALIGCVVTCVLFARTRTELRRTQSILALKCALDSLVTDEAIATAVDQAVAAVGGADQISEQHHDALRRCGRIRADMLVAIATSELRAATDSLTGLLNRRAMDREVEAMVARERMYSVAVADLDHFKALNDRCGHDAGDIAIRLFADALAEATREDEDIVCRFGGEEFVAVFPGLTQAHAEISLQRARAIFAAKIRDSALPSITASFGIAEVAVGDCFATAFGRADQALLRAKRYGRDRIVAATRPGKYHEIDRTPAFA